MSKNVLKCLKIYKNPLSPLMLPTTLEKRRLMAYQMRKQLPHVWGTNYMDRLWTSDEAWVELIPSSPGNYGSYGTKLHLPTVKKPEKLLVWAAMCKTDVFYVVLGDNKTRVNAEVYMNDILKTRGSIYYSIF